MKKIMKFSSITVFSLILSACGNLSKVDKLGNTKKTVFPKISSVSLKRGSEIGSWPNWDDVRQISKGMTKTQVQALIGRPHFSEGFFAVREWDYLFNYRENKVHKQCQFKVLFDKQMTAQNFYWYPNGCRHTVRFNMSFNLSGDLLFGFNQSSLNKQGKQAIADLAKRLKSMNVSEIRIEGHTDRIGSQKYNLKLSQQRAESVASELKRLGISTQMKSIGLGKSKQIKYCKGNGKFLRECLKPNRRVEIHIIGEKANAEQSVLKAGIIGPAILYNVKSPIKMEEKLL